MMATNWEGPLSLLARSKSAPVQESTVGTRKGLLNLIADKLAEKAKYAAGAFDPESQINQDVSSWHKKYQRGLADQIAGKDTSEAQEAYNTTMGLAGVAPIGMIAWHGSPHKFDKFDMSKIGTGEGAQAYGQGLYFAEAPDVAKSYQSALSADRGFSFDGKTGLTRAEVQDMVNAKYGAGYLDGVLRPSGVADSFIDDMVTGLIRAEGSYPKQYKPGSQRAKVYDELRGQITHADPGALYKVDIPDEAVARFLDWDKPLSEQAPEVQKALAKRNPDMYHPDADDYDAMEMGQSIYRRMFEDAIRSGKPLPAKQKEAMLTAELKKAGIPGIRYLDGGSRSAGQGSSNFVVFDPEMIRILERNEIPTGLKPWEPGEYQFAKGGSVADKMRDILRPRPIVQPGTDTATTGTRGYSDDLANWSFVL